MKKFLPLVALLVTTAISAPLFAADTTTSATTTTTTTDNAKVTHQHHHHKKSVKAQKKHIKHLKHKRNVAAKDGDTAAAQHYQQRIDNSQRMVNQEEQTHSDKVWLPSMRHGFQK